MSHDLEAPPVAPVHWIGWTTSGPKKIAEFDARLYFDARAAARRELGTDAVEVAQCSETVAMCTGVATNSPVPKDRIPDHLLLT